MDKIGVMVCGHGSRDPDAIREFESVARGIGAPAAVPVASGFLEFVRPVIRDGLNKLRARLQSCPGGAWHAFAAGHAKNGIPSVLNTYQAQHSGLRSTTPANWRSTLQCCRATGAGAGSAGDDVPLHETLLRGRARRLGPRCQLQRRQGHALVGRLRLAGVRPPTRASPSRWWSRAWSTPPSLATGASWSSPTSSSPGSW